MLVIGQAVRREIFDLPMSLNREIDMGFSGLISLSSHVENFH